MAIWVPINGLAIQLAKNAGGAAAADYYLKFYDEGTTTPTSMATDSTGGTTLDKCKLNSVGLAVNGSDDPFIPHIDRNYKIACYTNATDADNNATGSAFFVIDNVKFSAGEADGINYTPEGTNPTTVSIATYLDKRVLDDVTALRAYDPVVDEEQVFILGHTVKGKGGGKFYYDAADTTTPDNNGTTIVTAGGKRWKRSNVTGKAHTDWFGLSSSADVQADMQAIWGEFAHVHVDPGYYVCNGPLWLSHPTKTIALRKLTADFKIADGDLEELSTATIEFAGIGVHAANPDISGIPFGLGSGSRQDKSGEASGFVGEISNINFTIANDNNFTACVMRLWGCSQIKMRNVNIDARNGRFAIAGQNLIDPLFENVRIRGYKHGDPTLLSETPIVLDSESHNVPVTGCYLFEDTGPMLDPDTDTDVRDGSTNYFNDNIKIHDCFTLGSHVQLFDKGSGSVPLRSIRDSAWNFAVHKIVANNGGTIVDNWFETHTGHAIWITAGAVWDTGTSVGTTRVEDNEFSAHNDTVDVLFDANTPPRARFAYNTSLDSNVMFEGALAPDRKAVLEGNRINGGTFPTPTLYDLNDKLRYTNIDEDIPLQTTQVRQHKLLQGTLANNAGNGELQFQFDTAPLDTAKVHITASIVTDVTDGSKSVPMSWKFVDAINMKVYFPGIFGETVSVSATEWL